MKNRAPSVEETPIEIIQQLLQEYLDDSSAVMTGFEAELMTHEGRDGNALWRANIV